jgi:hypothetical protein
MSTTVAELSRSGMTKSNHPYSRVSSVLWQAGIRRIKETDAKKMYLLKCLISALFIAVVVR